MKKKAIKVLVFAGYGLNCEEETAYAFELAGAKADIVHINDLIDKKVNMQTYQILAVPGGFAYGDDTGSGKAYANRMRNHLWNDIEKFVEDGKLMIGICNGFQVLSQLRILPGALSHNDSNRYTDRWVDMKVVGESPWLKGISKISAPIAHGEGKFIADKKLIAQMKKEKAIALLYERGEMANYLDLPANPNGSVDNVAGVLSHKGRVFGLMPHPERGMFFTNRPDWPFLKRASQDADMKLPEYTEALRIFKNGVEYFNK